jgi:hypothetical protein
MLPTIRTRKLFCTIPTVFGVGLLLTLWLLLPHPAESNDYTVCPTGCDYTTIQSAVTNAPEGSTILVAAGVYRESVHITQSLSLEGAGSISTTISTYTLTEYSSVITVSKGITVALKGFHISDGTGSLVGDNGYGGAIYNQGTLLIENTNIDDHRILVGSSHYGIAIYNQGVLKLVNTSIRSFYANTGSSIYGGNIFNEGVLEIESSTLGEGGGADYDAAGGSIYNRGVAYVRNTMIYGSDLESKFTTAKGGGVYNQGSMSLENVLLMWNGAYNSTTAYGGAIYNEGDLALNQVSMIENGAYTSPSADEPGSALGGGIYNGCGLDGCGVLTIASSVLYGNRASGGNGQHGGGYINGRDGIGGGVYNACGAAGCASVVISNTLITGNRAKGGDGGFQSFPHWSPIPGYGASGFGGGIYNEGGEITLWYSTVGDNDAVRGEASPEFEGISQGGGIFNGWGTIFLKGTLIAGNEASDNGPDCWGELTSQGYNLLQNVTNCTISGDPAGNLLGLDPLLFPPGDYGDPTPTQPIAFNSPAVDAADPLDCPPTDQRGLPRPVDGNQDGTPRCDIGAYERLPPTDYLYLPLLPRP